MYIAYPLFRTTMNTPYKMTPPNGRPHRAESHHHHHQFQHRNGVGRELHFRNQGGRGWNGNNGRVSNTTMLSEATRCGHYHFFHRFSPLHVFHYRITVTTIVVNGPVIRIGCGAVPRKSEPIHFCAKSAVSTFWWTAATAAWRKAIKREVRVSHFQNCFWWEMRKRNQ